jgi:hypothetical protein
VSIRGAGFAPRTLLMVTSPGQGLKLKEEVVQNAVEIEGVARALLGEDGRLASNDKGKGKAVEREDSSSSVGKKLPKWLGKLSKK